MAKQWAKSHVPGLERMASAEEIAAFALVLASDDHPCVTGTQMVIDGGKTAHAGRTDRHQEPEPIAARAALLAIFIFQS